jgi:hypothetical protein
VGETQQGYNKHSQLKRPDEQVKKLEKETGKEFRIVHLRDYNDKAKARSFEEKLIRQIRKKEGGDALPGNKNNR